MGTESTPNVRESGFQESLPDGKARCLVCPRGCVIAEGRRGFCHTRLNRGGRVHTLTYGLASSVMADTIEKKPVFHYQPGSMALSLGSFGCNLRCIHCQNWRIAHVKPAELQEDILPPHRLVELALRRKCQGIAWTYNEPTLWLEYTIDGAESARKEGLYTCYVTNGYITKRALDALGPLLDIYRVDVKGFSADFYRRLAHARDWKAVLRAAERAGGHWGMHVEVVTNVIPGWNDEPRVLRSIARWIFSELGPETPWHVTRFVPHLKLSHLDPTPVRTLERGREIGGEEGLRFVYLGNVPGHPAQNTYCPHCGERVISRYGMGVDELRLDGNRCARCGSPLPITGPARVTAGRRRLL